MTCYRASKMLTGSPHPPNLATLHAAWTVPDEHGLPHDASLPDVANSCFMIAALVC